MEQSTVITLIKTLQLQSQSNNAMVELPGAIRRNSARMP
jgi:hypothetical protein